MEWLLSPEEWSALRLSVIVATASVIASLPFAVLLGFLLARRNFYGKALVEILVNFSLVLPPVVLGYVLLLLLGKRGLFGAFLYEHFGITIAFSIWAAIIAAMLVSLPLLVQAVRVSFQAVDPRLEQAAQTLGASRLRTFFTVTLPLARYGLISGCVLGFARSLGEFGATIVFAGNVPDKTRTLSLAIFAMAERPGGLEQAWRLVLLSIVLAGASLYFSQRLERRAKISQ